MKLLDNCFSTESIANTIYTSLLNGRALRLPVRTEATSLPIWIQSQSSPVIHSNRNKSLVAFTLPPFHPLSALHHHHHRHDQDQPSKSRLSGLHCAAVADSLELLICTFIIESCSGSSNGYRELTNEYSEFDSQCSDYSISPESPLSVRRRSTWLQFITPITINLILDYYSTGICLHNKLANILSEAKIIAQGKCTSKYLVKGSNVQPWYWIKSYTNK